jgi:hypothetical protein
MRRGFGGDVQTVSKIACSHQNEQHNNNNILIYFVEREYTMDNAKGVVMHANAIMPRMIQIDTEEEEGRKEGAQICSKLLQIIEFTKTNDHSSRNWAQIQGASNAVRYGLLSSRSDRDTSSWQLFFFSLA